MLYFHNEKELQWENVSDRDKLLKYIDKIDQMKVGPEGQLTKFERVHEVFRYLKGPRNTTSTSWSKSRKLRVTFRTGRRH